MAANLKANQTRGIDQDLWDLTQQYVRDHLAILKRAGVDPNFDTSLLEFFVQLTAEHGQEMRDKAGFKYEPPITRPDTV